MSRLRLGALRTLVTPMRRADTTINSVGQPNDEWVAMRDPFFAGVEAVRGDEPWLGANNVGTAQLKVTSHYWSDLKITDRLRMPNGEDLEILAVLDPNFDKSLLLMPCKWVQLMGDGANNADGL